MTASETAEKLSFERYPLTETMSVGVFGSVFPTPTRHTPATPGISNCGSIRHGLRFSPEAATTRSSFLPRILYLPPTNSARSFVSNHSERSRRFPFSRTYFARQSPRTSRRPSSMRYSTPLKGSPTEPEFNNFFLSESSTDVIPISVIP